MKKAKFTIMTKSSGPLCNLSCKYCYYLEKTQLYSGTISFQMSDEVLEIFVRQYIESQYIPEVQFCWQGGEPTLSGLNFFRRAVDLQKKYANGKKVTNAFQTNGVLLNNEWCDFFRRENFLIGLSLDGPKELHDVYRIDRRGKPTFERVIRGLYYLKKHNVDFNILTTVHAANADSPLEVYRYLRDDVGAQFIQFIPIVTREKTSVGKNRDPVIDWCVRGKQYGKFLRTIFDEWVRHDVGRIYVQIFDVALEKWAGGLPTLCSFSPICGMALAMEHNGDVYTCDHFVEPPYLLGNIRDTAMLELVASDRMRNFVQNKRDSLPKYCLQCDVLFACNGGCPKNRISTTPDGELGLNYLCDGYKDFFHHIDRPMRMMADLLRRGKAPSEIMQLIEAEDLQKAFTRAKRNESCPCNSGKEFKYCHGRK